MTSFMTIVDFPKPSFHKSIARPAQHWLLQGTWILEIAFSVNAHLQWLFSYVSGVDPRLQSWWRYVDDYHVAVVADVVSAELQECYKMEYPPTSPHINAFFRKYSIVLFVVLCPCSTCSNRLVPNSRKLHYILGKKPKWFWLTCK